MTETCAFYAVIDGKCASEQIAAEINDVAPTWGDIVVREISRTPSADWSDVAVRVVLLICRGRQYLSSVATVKWDGDGEADLVEGIAGAVMLATDNIRETYGERARGIDTTLLLPVGGVELFQAFVAFRESFGKEEMRH